MKYRTYALGAILAVLLSLSGCSDSDAATNAPKANVNEGKDLISVQEPAIDQESSADTPEVEESLSPELLYAPILEKYTTALAQGYDMEQLREAGLNYMCAYYDDVTQIGYAFLDIDQNGTPELLIGEVGGEDCFFDLYIAVEGNPILVAQSAERDRYYLCADGAIANEGSNGASSDSTAFYTVGEQGQLILSEAIIYDEEYGSDRLWYSTSAVSAEGASSLSWESAALIYKKHEYATAVYTSFFPDGLPSSTTEESGIAGEYDDIVGSYHDEHNSGFGMFIGYNDTSKTEAYVYFALAIEDFSVKLQNREDGTIIANDLNLAVASEPGHAADLDISQPGKITASIYISEYDFWQEITFVPSEDSQNFNPYYVG